MDKLREENEKTQILPGSDFNTVYQERLLDELREMPYFHKLSLKAQPEDGYWLQVMFVKGDVSIMYKVFSSIDEGKELGLVTAMNNLVGRLHLIATAISEKDWDTIKSRVEEYDSASNPDTGSGSMGIAGTSNPSDS